MFSKLDPGVFGSAFAIFFAIGLVGATSIPASVGVVARQRPIRCVTISTGAICGV
jgi:hypothetical protein